MGCANIPVRTIVQSKPSGLKFNVYPDDVYFDLYYFNIYEYFETNLILSVLKRGDTFFDIGANFGWFSLHALNTVGRSGHVFSFEPQPEVCKEIELNAALNGFKDSRNLTICNCAVGEKNGVIKLTRMHGRSHALTTMVLQDDEKVTIRNSAFAVPIITLDDFIKGIDDSIAPPSFIKCDVEGAELQVLHGSKKICMSKSKPVWLIEINRSTANAFGWQPEEMVTFLEECGYTDFFFVSHAIRPTLIRSVSGKRQLKLPDNGNLVAIDGHLHKFNI